MGSTRGVSKRKYCQKIQYEEQFFDAWILVELKIFETVEKNKRDKRNYA